MKSLIQITPLDLASRFIGIKEVRGAADNPQITAMLRLDGGAHADEVPWCSAFVNYVCWLLRCERSKSLAARSWLRVGRPVEIGAAAPGFHVVILKRGAGEQPGPEVLAAPGHVGFLERISSDTVWLLGGNQGDTVSVAPFRRDKILGIREV